MQAARLAVERAFDQQFIAADNLCMAFLTDRAESDLVAVNPPSLAQQLRIVFDDARSYWEFEEHLPAPKHVVAGVCLTGRRAPSTALGTPCRLAIELK